MGNSDYGKGTQDHHDLLRFMLKISMTLKQVEVTRSKTTTIPSSYGMSGTTGDSGGSASTEKNEDESFIKKAGSILFNLFNK